MTLKGVTTNPPSVDTTNASTDLPQLETEIANLEIS